MIDPRRADVFVEAAQQHYSYELPYHNWNHAEAVIGAVERVVDRAAERGINLSKQALRVAAAWHDAGYHIDTHTFETKEHYSLSLLEDYLEDNPVSTADRTIMSEAILGTIHGNPERTQYGLALHYADVENIGGPRDDFIANSLLLYEEANGRSATPISWASYVEGSSRFLEQVVEQSRNELPLLGEPTRVEGSFDTSATENLRSLRNTLL